MAVKNCFIRGSVVRYVKLPAEHVDKQLLEDATRRGEQGLSNALTFRDAHLFHRGCESSKAMMILDPVALAFCSVTLPYDFTLDIMQ